MKTYTLGALAVVALAMGNGMGCSSGSGGSGGATGDDGTGSSSGGATGDDAATCNPCGDDGGSTTGGSGHDSNPDGVPYPNPSGGYGRTARSGGTAGSVLQNFKFLGYPGADSSKGLQTISMADYYDPCNKRFKMIHLSVAAVWCVPCNEETDAVVAAKAQLDSEQVVILQALDDGPVQGVPATTNDLSKWVTNHKSNFTEMLDPGLQNLGGFFNAAAIPWNADLDPRTMELLDSTEGWSGDVSTEIDTSIVPATPSYAIPAAAQCQ